MLCMPLVSDHLHPRSGDLLHPCARRRQAARLVSDARQRRGVIGLLAPPDDRHTGLTFISPAHMQAGPQGGSPNGGERFFRESGRVPTNARKSAARQSLASIGQPDRRGRQGQPTGGVR